MWRRCARPPRAVARAPAGRAPDARHALVHTTDARVVELSGGRRAGDVAVTGDERTVAAEVRRHRDAGATEVVFSGTGVAGEAARRRTWALLGELAG